MTSQEPELDPVDVEVDEPITVTDRRRIDPETGEVRPGGAEEAQSSEEADTGSAEVAELTAALQRERAQFANYKRRTEEEKQGRVAYGKQILIDKLLPVLDDLDRAREHGDLEGGPLKGVADKLIATLDAEGLTKFGTPGDLFDPELHEAVQNDGSGAEPVIGAVYRSGYRLGDKVIRTAMVTVTDPDPAQQSEPQNQQSGAQ
ncbi:nucleotide exchange factor GrpE [Gordonia aichiensis]|uniref:Protein GrpE n=1 Tax=Gordonia aichiensis NBRC 108223 TaxID=1220583 RepID=L7KQF6_9ACTN|nr:nucleotide exchange factor GrpE [Gordonia aichiensis]GAC50187.1 protein GrpE [Gordonia aichiensis NBRC 108223]